MAEQRIVDIARTESEAEEQSLRPRRLDEYIGQGKAKGNLAVFIKAARMRGEALDHVLLYGPPGLGKTTLAGIVAAEMGVSLRVTSGPAIERARDLAAILTNLSPFDVLFIDEIHRLNRSVEEVLYPAMEDYALDIVIGEGPAARSIRIDLPSFTLVGATTRAGMISAPLHDRFGVVSRLEMYTQPELEAIVRRSAGILSVSVDAEGAREVARRARGTPRIANRLLRRLRDFAQVMGDGRVTAEIARLGLDALEVDGIGLDSVDRDMMLAIIRRFDGGPVGLDTLASSIGEDPGTIEDVYEPYLLQLGFISKTPRGRVATRLAYEHFGESRNAGDGDGAGDAGRTGCAGDASRAGYAGCATGACWGEGAAGAAVAGKAGLGPGSNAAVAANGSDGVAVPCAAGPSEGLRA